MLEVPSLPVTGDLNGLLLAVRCDVAGRAVDPVCVLVVHRPLGMMWFTAVTSSVVTCDQDIGIIDPQVHASA